MKILIISYSYAPVISPRAFRWTAIAEYWSKQGEQVDVICSCNPGLMRSETINGVHIHRIGNIAGKILRGKFKNNILIKNKKLKKKDKTKNVLASFLNLIYKYTWKKIYWPDYACLWFFPAVKKVKKLIAINKYDVLISVSLPFIDHIIGLIIKKYNPNILWIMDIGDPFYLSSDIPINNYKIYRRLNYITERKIINLADFITVTTEVLLKMYKNVFPKSNNKIYTIPPLISLSKKIKYENRIFLNKNKIKFIFIGTLYKKIRNPKYLLRLFSKLLDTPLSDKLELHFFGNIERCFDFFEPYKKLFNKKIFFHGLVNHDIAFQAMNEADFLVNIGNNTSYQLPSKVVEYASTGKPIINIVKSDKDSTIDFFKKYPASLCLVENEAKVDSNYLSKITEFIKNPPFVEPLVLKIFLANFQIENIAEYYSRLLKLKYYLDWE
jgi:hypothetical protein